MNAQCHSKHHQRRLATIVPLAGALVAAAISVAQAQPIETVTVTAPRIVHQTIVTGRSSTTGAPIEETTISRVVSYADLDLAKAADADAFKARVEDAARDLCAELDKLYPLEPKDPSCARTSVARVMPRVNILISDAHEK